MSKEVKKIKFGDRTLTLKNDGTPNLRNLKKEEKEVAKTFIAKKKKAKQEAGLEELKKLLEKL